MAELGYPGPGCLRGALLEARPPTLPRVRGARRDAIPGPQVRHGVSPLAPLRAWAGSLLLALLLGAGFRLKAVEGTEAGNFDAAAKEYTAGFWKQAEADFGEFAKKYPESTKLPEVFLCQAVARFHQTNYAGTIELLSNRQGQAGKWAEDYFFWRAKALQAKGDSAGAAEGFAKLIQQFPASGLCLEAGVEEARALAKLGDWARVIDLLQKPQGTFQNAVRTNASGEAVVSGWLLLGEAQFARQDYAGAEAAVKPLAALRPNPGATWPWQWHYLVSRLRVAQGHPEEALGTTSNLLAAAASAGDAGQLAESYAFVGGLFERLGRTEEAINAYTNNLAAGMPAE